MNGTRKFVDVAEEAMGKNQGDKLWKGVEVSVDCMITHGREKNIVNCIRWTAL